MSFSRWTRFLAVAAGASCLLVLAPTPAGAQAGTGAFELYGGYYFPENDVLDDDVTYGLRGTYRWTDAVAFELSVGRYETERGFAGVARLDYELILVDLSAAWTFNPGSPAEIAIFGGPGWAFADASARAVGVGALSASDDSFTLHFGVDLQISLSDRVYLRPDVRARYFDDSEDVDLEASIGIGFRIGV
jgi:hypothetical protein